MVNEYEAIGFDIDLVLVRYHHLKAMVKRFIYDIFQGLITKFNYPEHDTIGDFDFDKQMNVCFNRAVWDIKNGAILKLAEGKKITHAI